MSWASDIRETLNNLALVSDPAWQSEYLAQLKELNAGLAEVSALIRERHANPPKPPSPPKPARQKSPDGDSVGTVKNIRPKRPFVHDVPPPSLPRGHR